MNKVNTCKFPVGFFMAGLLIICCVSCGIGTTKIGDIIGHPRDYAGKEVTISGEVTEAFSLVVVKRFVVRDSSGEITVVTERTLPVKGEKIKVKGKVQEAFSLGTEQKLVIIETPEKMK